MGGGGLGLLGTLECFLEGHMWRNIFTNLQIWIQIKKGWRDWEEGAGPPPESGKTIPLLPVAAVG